jgi:hypothetical protein
MNAALQLECLAVRHSIVAKPCYHEFNHERNCTPVLLLPSPEPSLPSAYPLRSSRRPLPSGSTLQSRFQSCHPSRHKTSRVVHAEP